MLQVLTIGHSTHSIEHFVTILQRHGVEAIADVRSVPASRFMPQFNKERLQTSLEAAGIRYVFLGKELGARSPDPDCYIDGKVRYSLLAKTAVFKSGIKRVIDGAAYGRIALMCTEQEPLSCHRTVLIARVLYKHGIQLSHILGDGRMESHEDAMERLRARHNLTHPSLLESDEELLRQALELQESEIAYVEKQLVTGT